MEQDQIVNGRHGPPKKLLATSVDRRFQMLCSVMWVVGDILTLSFHIAAVVWCLQSQNRNDWKSIRIDGMVFYICIALDLRIKHFYHNRRISSIVPIMSVTHIVQLQFKPSVSAATIQDVSAFLFCSPARFHHVNDIY